MQVAIIAITGNGARTGATLQDSLRGSRLFVIEKHASANAEPFSHGLQPLVDRLWQEYQGFVFIAATGIVVRTVAPHLRGKECDPAVVVLDDAGRFAISLLSGHLGGANELAKKCAAITGGTAVITTATDVNDLPSFDMLAKQNGWLIDDLSRVKVLNSLLLEGKEIAVVGECEAVKSYCAGKGILSYHLNIPEALASGAAGQLYVTNQIVPSQLLTENTLVLRPVNLCLGIGCNRGTAAEEIKAVVARNMERLSLSSKSVKCVATAAAKGDEVGLAEFAKLLGVPVICFAHEDLNAVEFPSPPSAYALQAIGAKGVAEPAALLASKGGRLLLHKVKDGNVTLAIAETLTY
jgi:cobalt-precorrin 5A hydrolase